MPRRCWPVRVAAWWLAVSLLAGCSAGPRRVDAAPATAAEASALLRSELLRSRPRLNPRVRFDVIGVTPSELSSGSTLRVFHSEHHGLIAVDRGVLKFLDSGGADLGSFIVGDQDADGAAELYFVADDNSGILGPQARVVASTAHGPEMLVLVSAIGRSLNLRKAEGQVEVWVSRLKRPERFDLLGRIGYDALRGYHVVPAGALVPSDSVLIRW